MNWGYQNTQSIGSRLHKQQLSCTSLGQGTKLKLKSWLIFLRCQVGPSRAEKARFLCPNYWVQPREARTWQVACHFFLFVLCIFMTWLTISQNQNHFATVELSYIVNYLSTKEYFTNANKPGRNQQNLFYIFISFTVRHTTHRNVSWERREQTQT